MVGLLDPIAATAQVPVAVAGQLMTAFALANGLGTPAVLLATARLERGRLLMGALVLLAVGCLVTTFASSFGALLAGRVLMGVGAGIFQVTAMVLAATMAAPERRTSAIATIAMGYGSALVFGVPLGRLVASVTDWRWLFAGIGIFALVAIAGVARWVPAVTGPAPAGRAGGAKEQLAMLRQPAIAAAYGVTFTMFMGYAAVNTFIAPFLAAVSPVDDAALNGALMALGLSTIAGTRLGGYAADRFGMRATMLAGMAAQVAALAALSTVAGTKPLAIGLLMTWAAAAWATGPTLAANLIRLAPEAAGVLIGLNGSVVQLSMAAGAAVGGLVVAQGAVGSIGWVGATGALLAAGLTVVSFELARRHAHALAGHPLPAAEKTT